MHKIHVQKRLSILTSTLTVLLALSAFALSYSVLYQLALSHGFHPWLAWLWPLSLDAFVIIATLAVVRNSLWGESTGYPMLLVGLFTLLSIILNTVDASNLVWLVEINPQLASAMRGTIYVLVHALPPTVVFLSIELAATIGKSEVRRFTEIKTQTQLQQETAEMRQRLATERAELQTELDTLADQHLQLENAIAALRDKQATLKQEVADLNRHKQLSKKQQPASPSETIIDQAKSILSEWYRQGTKPNGSEFGRRLGKSASLGRQLKRELWPDIVANGTGLKNLDTKGEPE